MPSHRTHRRWSAAVAVVVAAVASISLVSGAAAKETPKGPQLTLYAIQCPTWQQVPANEQPTEWDETGHGPSLDASADATLADAADIPATCEGATDWTFTFATGNDASPTRSVSVAKSQTVTLTEAETKAMVNDGLWVRVYAPNGGQFAGLRCFDDVLFGDSTEVVRAASDAAPVCIAYSVRTNAGPQEPTLLAATCSSWSAVPANADPTTWDETGHGKELDATAGTAVTSAADIPASCDKGENFSYELSRASDGAVLDTQTVSSRNGKTLTLDSRSTDALSGSGIFVRVTVKKGYAFAGLRCYDDIIFSDNLELLFVPAGAGPVKDMTCIAFAVKQ